MSSLFTSQGDNDDNDGFTVVRGKQSKRQRISSSGQSGVTDQAVDGAALFESDFSDLSTDQKFSLILSKLSVNEIRVSSIDRKVDELMNVSSRVDAVENVVRSQHDRLKLLEYRSIDLEARGRRKNLLFKGIPENRRENCFQEVRRIILEELGIERDMYLERAHRLGRFDSSKTRPIIVAFCDFCDTLEILNAASSLKDTRYSVCRDYPSEISKAHQSLWRQFKETRESNPNRKVTLEYPAAIYVNGVLVADAFPDWYPTLRGSRVSVIPQTQSQTQSGGKPIHSYSNSIVTGIGARPRDVFNSTSTRPLNLSMGQQANMVTNAPNDITQERGRDEDSLFPPTLPSSAPPTAPNDKIQERDILPPPSSTPSRGRSPTRKKTSSSRPRNQASASRSRARSVKRSASRSLSIGPQSNQSQDINQAAGGSSTKKLGTSKEAENESSSLNETNTQPPHSPKK